MAEPDLVKRLRELPSDETNNTARVREHLQHIEDALKRRVQLPQILAAFNEGRGENVMTLASFKSALKRVREERQGGNEGSRLGASTRRSKGSAASKPAAAASSDARPLSEFFADLRKEKS